MMTAPTADCHFHVIAPLDRAPMAPERSYTPAPSSIDDWRAAMAPLGVTHGVVIQPSFYGTDNRVLLETLRRGQGQLVGVAAVDQDVSDTELDRLVNAGIRGVRVAHFPPGDPRAMGGFVRWEAFDALEPRLAERGLHLQLFTDSRLLPGIATRIRRSRVSIVVDHMGRAPARLGAAHEGIKTLLALMRDAPVWVKLSGLANLADSGPEYKDVRIIHEALVSSSPDRLIWGSDWPFTKPTGVRPEPSKLMQLFRDWTPEEVRKKIEWENAVRLYRLATDGSCRVPDDS